MALTVADQITNLQKQIADSGYVGPKANLLKQQLQALMSASGSTSSNDPSLATKPAISIPDPNGTSGNTSTPGQPGMVEPPPVAPVAPGEQDRSVIEQEGQRQFGQETATLGQQVGIQKTRLSDLAKLLGEQESYKFNQKIPELASTAQNQGFLETSGFGNALARERANLAATTEQELGKQALSDRDLEIAGIGTAGQNVRGFQTAGLTRKFDVSDQERADALARELGRMGVAAPPKGPSAGQKFVQGAAGGAAVGASVGGPWGAAAGGVLGGIASFK